MPEANQIELMERAIGRLAMLAARVETNTDWLLVAVRRWRDGVPSGSLYPDSDGRQPADIIADTLGKAPRTAADRLKEAHRVLPTGSDFPQAVREEVIACATEAGRLQPERNRYVHDAMVLIEPDLWSRSGGYASEGTPVTIADVERLVEEYKSLATRTADATFDVLLLPTRARTVR